MTRKSTFRQQNGHLDGSRGANCKVPSSVSYLVILNGEGFDIVTHYMKLLIQFITFAVEEKRETESGT